MVHVHFHLLSFDGVCQQQPDGTVVLQRAPTPRRWQVRELVERITVRASAIAGRARAQPEEEVVLAQALKRMDTPPDERPTPELVAEHDGFNLQGPAVARERPDGAGKIAPLNPASPPAPHGWRLLQVERFWMRSP